MRTIPFAPGALGACPHPESNMPDLDRFKLEEIIDPLARISEIIFKRLHTMECNACEPCGPVFMESLQRLQKLGRTLPSERELAGAKRR